VIAIESGGDYGGPNGPNIAAGGYLIPAMINQARNEYP